MLKTYLAVMLGGAVGTGLRMAAAAGCAAKFGESFPVGTLLVNVVGSFVIGFAAVWLDDDGIMRPLVMVGVLGGFTTFSSFSLATLDLLSSGEFGKACANIVASVALCLLVVWLGQLAGAACQR